MECKGFVSLWLGSIDKKESLSNLLTNSYTDEGDIIVSDFAKLFSINRYDDDTLEMEYFEESQETLDKLLAGFSYDDAIIKKSGVLIPKEPVSNYNAVILIYDYKYCGEPKTAKIQECYFEYVGAVNYE
jgi:hypothetical protein